MVTIRAVARWPAPIPEIFLPGRAHAPARVNQSTVCPNFCTVCRYPHRRGPMDTTAAALTEARDRLSEIVDQVAVSSDVFTITKHGRPLAVVLGYDEYESLIETLNILGDADTMDAIGEARNEATVDSSG